VSLDLWKDLFPGDARRAAGRLRGPFGTFIGVPIALAILTFCAQHPSSRWVADLLGGPAETKPGKL
jgi:hypothetical protein